MNAQDYIAPIGTLRIFAEGDRLCAITLLKGEKPPLAGAKNETTALAAEQLHAYFSGKREHFSLPVQPRGTRFQLVVWSALASIPYGSVITYGQLAAAIGRPTACRAVANAVGKNPLLIVLPCHRVVAANGIGGFSAGVEAKRALLRSEGINFQEKSVFRRK